MTQYGFYFNGQRCTGCKTCVMACKDKNDLAETINFRNVLEYGGGTWTRADDGTWGTDTFAYNVSVACNHCDMPACLENAPREPLRRTTRRARCCATRRSASAAVRALRRAPTAPRR